MINRIITRNDTKIQNGYEKNLNQEITNFFQLIIFKKSQNLYFVDVLYLIINMDNCSLHKYTGTINYNNKLRIKKKKIVFYVLLYYTCNVINGVTR